VARILFFGTPLYAQVIAAGLYRRFPGDQWRVVTKPDKPQGRKRVLTPSTVAQWAAEEGLPVDKPGRWQDFWPIWAAFQPDWIVTAAYGRILPDTVLQLARWGAYNLHASLLPRWRGPNPIAWAIRAGDEVTGVTLMAMDTGVDTGPIVLQERVPIDSTDTRDTLTVKLAESGIRVFSEARQLYGDGPWPADPQPSTGVTMAPKFQDHESRIVWHEPALVIDRLIRSMSAEPGAYTIWEDQRIKILAAEPVAKAAEGRFGRAILDGNDWLVTTGDGYLRVRQIHPAGKRPMTPGDFLRGRRDKGLVIFQ